MSCVRHIYHVIFSTKHRQKLIDPALRDAVYPYIGGIIRKHKGSLIEIGGVEDHVHILAYFHQSIAVADMIRNIKSGSSLMIKEEGLCPTKFHWQQKYGSFTVSHSLIATVQTYIQGQEEHHCKESYQDEFRAFMQRHGYEFDERYIWE